MTVSGHLILNMIYCNLLAFFTSTPTHPATPHPHYLTDNGIMVNCRLSMHTLTLILHVAMFSATC